MEQIVSWNGRLVDAASAGLQPLTQAALYGRGVFTTIAVFDGEPFLWDKHWLRLSSNAAAVGLACSSHKETYVSKNLLELLSTNPGFTGRCRMTLFDTSSAPLWPHKAEGGAGLLITLGGIQQQDPEKKLLLSPFAVNSRSPLAGIKSCNYLENILALMHARSSLSDEAVRINEKGEITSACMANIFWVRDERLYTPALATGCIAGTTRALVLESLECTETAAGETELHKAEAVFLTSAGLGICEASTYLSRTFTPSQHPILRLFPAAGGGPQTQKHETPQM